MKIVLKIFVVALVSLLVLGCESDNSTTGTMEKISTSEVKTILDEKNENYILIDVREVDEYNESHIPGAINIPLNNLSTVDYSKDIILIVYCRSGARSNTAAIKLKNMGYNVKDMGGILDWEYEIEN